MPESVLPLLDLLALCQDGVSLSECSELAREDDIADLEESGIVGIRREGNRWTVRLSSRLLADRITSRIPPNQRRRILLEHVERIEERGARRRDDPLRTAVARLAATGYADPDVLVRGALRARRNHDYRRVVELLEPLPDGHRTIDTLVLLGDSYSRLGMPDDAEAVLGRADRLAVGDRDITAVTRARVTNLYYVAVKHDEAVRISRDALERVSTPAARTSIRNGMARMRPSPVSLQQGWRSTWRRNSPDRWSSTNGWRTCRVRTVSLAVAGMSGQAVELAESAGREHVRWDHAALRQHPAASRIPLVMALAGHGRIDDALRLGEATFGIIAREPGPAPSRGWPSTSGGRRCSRAGSVRRGTGTPRRSRRREPRERSGSSGSPLPVRRLPPHSRATSDSPPPLSPTSRASRTSGTWRARRSWAGDGPRRRTATSGGRWASCSEAESARASRHRTSEALLLTDVARLGGAQEVTGRMEELARGGGGELLRLRHEFCAGLARGDAERLHRTGTELAGIGAVLLAAEACAAASGIVASGGDERRAAALSNTSEKYRQACQGAGTPLLAAVPPAVRLSRREVEEAAMAAAGVPSRTMAETLTLSVRTVEKHLARIYGKLGVRSREELAAVLDRG